VASNNQHDMSPSDIYRKLLCCVTSPHIVLSACQKLKHSSLIKSFHSIFSYRENQNLFHIDYITPAHLTKSAIQY